MSFCRCVHYIKAARSIRLSGNGNGKDSFSPTTNLDADPDHRQKLITSKLPFEFWPNPLVTFCVIMYTN